MRTTMLALALSLLAASPASAFDDGGFTPGVSFDATTVAGLVDQGYGVDPTAADTYALPFLAASRAEEAPAEEEHHDHLEPVAPLPGNRMP